MSEYTKLLGPPRTLDESDMLRTLIAENGREAFLGAVYLATNIGKKRVPWRWLQTVLGNGDWRRGYEKANAGRASPKTPVMPIDLDDLFKDENAGGDYK